MHFNFKLNGYAQAFHRGESMKMKFILAYYLAFITNLKFY